MSVEASHVRLILLAPVGVAPRPVGALGAALSIEVLVFVVVVFGEVAGVWTVRVFEKTEQP